MREKMSKYKTCDGCGEETDCLPAGPGRWECEVCEQDTEDEYKLNIYMEERK
jgi:hypothetical protein